LEQKLLQGVRDNLKGDAYSIPSFVVLMALSLMLSGSILAGES
jgi:hypothetical protein